MKVVSKSSIITLMKMKNTSTFSIIEILKTILTFSKRRRRRKKGRRI